MGIWLLVQAIQYLCYSLPGTLTIISSPNPSTLLNLCLTLAPFLITFSASLFLIKKTDSIYSFLKISPQENNSPISNNEFQQIIIAGIGIYTLSYSLPSLVNSLISYIIISRQQISMVSESTSGINTGITKHILTTLLGFGLILYSIKLSNLLKLLRVNQNNV